jgi:hypothetical protein
MCHISYLIASLLVRKLQWASRRLGIVARTKYNDPGPTLQSGPKSTKTITVKLPSYCSLCRKRENCTMKSFYNLFASLNMIRVIKARRMGLVRHVARMGDYKCVRNFGWKI